ncbi:MAG: diacylglycerol kinase family lipid kinase [Oscillospiraceae bacterium]
MNKKMLFIVNPLSGKAEMKTHLCDVIDLFIKNGYSVNVHITQSKGDAKYMARRAENYDIIVCSGGDGTLNETVCGIMENSSNPTLGYIPAGTVNDFASSLGISKDITTAAKNIVDGNLFMCDIGKFDDKYFSYIAAFGAFTDVSYSTPQQFKNIFGRAAYILEGIKQISNIKKHKLKFSANNETFEDEFIFGMITNSTSIAGIKTSNKHEIYMDDGLLEVILVKAPKNPLDLQLILNDVITQNFGSKLFYSFKTDKIQLSSQEKIQWTLDGEFGGEYNNCVIEAKKQALKIIVK